MASRQSVARLATVTAPMFEAAFRAETAALAALVVFTHTLIARLLQVDKDGVMLAVGHVRLQLRLLEGNTWLFTCTSPLTTLATFALAFPLAFACVNRWWCHRRRQW